MSSKQSSIKNNRDKEEVSGSDTVFDMLREKTPWVFGNVVRKPKINFPSTKSRYRINLPTPSKALGLIIIYIILFLLQTGLLYIIYRNPPAIGADSEGNAQFYYPGVHDQFIIEGIVASIVIFLASSGYLFLYQASKYIYDRSIALKILVLGFILIIFTFITLQFMLAVKTQAIRQFLKDLLDVYG